MQRGLQGSLAHMQNIYLRTVEGLILFSMKFTVMDFLGVVFVIGAIGFIVFRIRHHFRNDSEYAATNCPRCGSSIMRVHRSPFDRLLGMTILPHSRRYRCKNKSCGWEGLRHQRYHSGPSTPDREAP
jgi:predicted RNA-binding Zn-ribbon protein involved in translation (DUF1610 family)